MNAAVDFVSMLAGAWEGEGDGDFPTLEPFRYRERLRFAPHEDAPVLRYVQDTWRITDDGEVQSHWESGFLRARDDGSIDIHDAQESGRTEILRGTPVATGDGAWTVTLDSVSLEGDPRMVSSSRTLRLTESTLEYEMSMATDRVSPPRVHLRARLRRAR
ncbi:MAG TPA: FABP family protein [Acidimicrobiia bacterium]|nr:FABP family protein [Acidimicrobiia bacterium]